MSDRNDAGLLYHNETLEQTKLITVLNIGGGEGNSFTSSAGGNLLAFRFFDLEQYWLLMHHTYFKRVFSFCFFHCSS